jgi:ribose-phosphate pyrophosphokinase
MLEAGCLSSGIKVAASHALLVGPAAERLGKLPIERIYVSDTVPTPEQFSVPLQVVSLGPLLAETIQRLYKGQSIAGLV